LPASPYIASSRFDKHESDKIANVPRDDLFFSSDDDFSEDPQDALDSVFGEDYYEPTLTPVANHVITTEAPEVSEAPESENIPSTTALPSTNNQNPQVSTIELPVTTNSNPPLSTVPLPSASSSSKVVEASLVTTSVQTTATPLIVIPPLINDHPSEYDLPIGSTFVLSTATKAGTITRAEIYITKATPTTKETVQTITSGQVLSEIARVTALPDTELDSGDKDGLSLPGTTSYHQPLSPQAEHGLMAVGGIGKCIQLCGKFLLIVFQLEQ
jgi:hypothetical protein